MPRYYEPYVNDCFLNAYGSVLAHMGHNPEIILADYLSFMFEEDTGYIGATYYYKHYASVEFTEEELNTSLELVYFPATSVYDPAGPAAGKGAADGITIRWYIHDDYEVAAERTKELIDAGKPVIAFVDMHEMNYHPYYQKDHQLHAILITGYDEEQRKYDLFDKYKMGNCDFDGQLSYDDIRKGRTAEIPIVNPIVGEIKRPVRNLWVEVDASEGFALTEDKLKSILRKSRETMLGERTILGHACGLARIDALRQSLISKKGQELDEKTVFMLGNYYLQNFKGISRSRLRFKAFLEQIADKLPSEPVQAMIGDLEESAKQWQVSSTLALKLARSKRESILDDLNRQLQLIVETEGRVVEQMARVI
ncbi:hypothetical protein XYCOK13_40930 [Xylanibacillus composti]|uniref:Butirosin biosynthesis protein H N-terminal domain-containing protein n=1 Tax=Xylanibacillus composti TaxID=1572762 RepID=A0A8J4M3W3_9BACL|nr:hypothetical protein XYCOK13_40930 [Xylanibacillus composti]